MAAANISLALALPVWTFLIKAGTNRKTSAGRRFSRLELCPPFSSTCSSNGRNFCRILRMGSAAWSTKDWATTCCPLLNAFIRSLKIPTAAGSVSCKPSIASRMPCCKTLGAVSKKFMKVSGSWSVASSLIGSKGSNFSTTSDWISDFKGGLKKHIISSCVGSWASISKSLPVLKSWGTDMGTKQHLN